jgi:membrane protein implicated in regulation of membrane protease activity
MLIEYRYKIIRTGGIALGYIILWIVISAAALIVDIATSNIFFISFTLGGICALFAGMQNLTFSMQVFIFALISGISLSIVYPLITKKLKKSIPKILNMEQSYIGRRFTVEQDMTDKASIKIDGIYWTIRNTGIPLKTGDKAEIIGIEGNKLTVKKVEEE